MEDTKTLLIFTLSSLAAYLSSLNGILIAGTIVFILNFLIGLVVAGEIIK